MNWIDIVDKLIYVLLGGLSAYYALRERLVKVEARTTVLEKALEEEKTANSLIYQELKSSIDKLNNTINKLEKSIVRLETLNENGR